MPISPDYRAAPSDRASRRASARSKSSGRHGRGGLTPTQRAEVLAFAQTWRREATGGVVIDRPVGRAERARCARFAAPGAVDPGRLRNSKSRHRNQAVSRLWPPARDASDQLSADGCGSRVRVACGQTISDRPTIPSITKTGRSTISAARHSAISPLKSPNPPTLYSRAPSAPAYIAKRTFGIDKWRKGESPATTYSESNKGAISDLGK